MVEGKCEMNPEKAFAPAAERNRAPILEVLSSCLSDGLVLEIGSGTGQHTAYFSSALPRIEWQPTEYDETRFDSIRAWVADSGAENVRPVVHLDARSNVWPVDTVDAIYSANVIHISPWTVTQGIFAGAERTLKPRGHLVLYGPFRFDGVWRAQSNQAFDERLRSLNPTWGVRDIEDIKSIAQQHGLSLRKTVECPANNHCLIFSHS